MIFPGHSLHSLLDANARWADAVDGAEPGFFTRSAQGQYPKVLWFGCADSRVPESVVTGARPGDIFVHRNIANQFHPDDDSALSVLSYAVHTVGVEHVVLAGHTHCGGAAACYQAVSARSIAAPSGPAPNSPLGRWLAPLVSLVSSLDLSNLSPDAALDRVVHENVKRQVDSLCDSAPIKDAWAEGKTVWVHGWVYDVASGRIKDLAISRGPPTPPLSS